MRFESNDFMKSHRQWHESRISKKNSDQNSTEKSAVAKKLQNIYGCVGSGDRNIAHVYTCYDHSQNSPKENSDSNADNDDARDDKGGDSNEPDPHESFVPTDFSKKELEQLTRSKEKRIQERIQIMREKAAEIDSYEQYSKGLSKSVEAFMTAHDKVKESNREKGIESSIEIDDLLLHMLPSHVWIGNFLNSSQDAVNKIQKRMLIDYGRNYA